MNFSTITLDLPSLSVAALLTLFAAMLIQAHRAKLTSLDLITDKGSGRISLTKVLNLVGGVVGIWVVWRMALDKTLTAEIFGLFLLYCAGTHGFSTYLSAKFKPGESKPE